VTDLFIDNWWQLEAWIMLLIGVVEVNALAQGVLWRFTQWLWSGIPNLPNERQMSHH